MRTTVPKKLFAHPRSAKGQLAKALSISLYPSHRSILAEREKQYGVPKSILLQVLLDEEVQHGLLGPALEARLIASNNRALAERLKTKETRTSDARTTKEKVTVKSEDPKPRRRGKP